jgi:hypothetical protein
VQSIDDVSVDQSIHMSTEQPYLRQQPIELELPPELLLLELLLLELLLLLLLLLELLLGTQFIWWFPPQHPKIVSLFHGSGVHCAGVHCVAFSSQFGVAGNETAKLLWHPAEQLNWGSRHQKILQVCGLYCPS